MSAIKLIMRVFHSTLYDGISYRSMWQRSTMFDNSLYYTWEYSVMSLNIYVIMHVINTVFQHCRYTHGFHLVLILFVAVVLLLWSSPEGVNLCAVGELKGTGVHVAKPLLLWERGQTEEKETPLSPRLSHIPILSPPSLALPPPPLLGLSLSATELGWLEIQTTNEST